MKRFRNVSCDFLKCKALEFLGNFVRNHQDSIEDNDVFNIIDELVPPDELSRCVKKEFSERRLTMLQNLEYRHDRLDFTDDSKEILREIWSHKPSRKTLRVVIQRLIDGQVAGIKTDFSREVFPRQLAELQRTLGLSELEKDILLVCFMACNNLLCLPRGNNEYEKIIFIAKSLDCNYDAVLKAFAPQEKLRRYNCLDNELDFNRDLGGFFNGSENEPLANSFFKQFKGEVLPWEFYGELARRHGAILKEMIRAGKGDSPVNILLYGAPGTGKTSFARTLAAELQLDCYCIAQNTNEKRSGGRTCSTPEFRFGALQVCGAQVDPAKSLVIVDEADEMLRGRSGMLSFLGDESGGVAGDKGLLNCVLDAVRTPTVWITNTRAEELDESSRRRFDYSIRFEPLSASQRAAIWRNNVVKMKLVKLFDDPMVEFFAARYAVSAGGITLVLQNVAKLRPAKSGVVALVEKLMAPHCELLNIPTGNEKLLPAKDYSLDGVNLKSDVALSQLVAAIGRFQADDGTASPDRPRMNLLLSGPPGTGKTEFVKYLGSVLKTKVIVKMGGDLLSMYVGGTEQNIKRAFAEAEAEKAILFLDEIDGLLQSRDRAQRSWEVTQVNELLFQMENFAGVLIGATNFAANLDAATLRRFTFKVEFDFLTEAGKLGFFERIFKRTLEPREKARLAAIAELAPGDFRTVRQSMYYLGGSPGNAEYLAALEHESEVKRANRSSAKKLGFSK